MYSTAMIEKSLSIIDIVISIIELTNSMIELVISIHFLKFFLNYYALLRQKINNVKQVRQNNSAEMILKIFSFFCNVNIIFETRKSFSDTRKSFSETRKSFSETRKAISETRKSFSETENLQLNVNFKSKVHVHNGLFFNNKNSNVWTILGVNNKGNILMIRVIEISVVTLVISTYSREIDIISYIK